MRTGEAEERRDDYSRVISGLEVGERVVVAEAEKLVDDARIRGERGEVLREPRVQKRHHPARNQP